MSVDLSGTGYLGGPRELHVPWREAVGGLWGPLGRLQFDYLVGAMDVTPRSHVLDIGCGSGRLAVHLAPYLAPDGRYVGVDHDAYLLGAFRREVGEFGETLHDGSLEFPTLGTGTFTHAWAQSVATHLRDADVRRMLAGAWRVLEEGGQFGFTYFPHPEEGGRPGEFNVSTFPDRDPFHYRTSYLRGIARNTGWRSSRVEDHERWPHPRGQRLLVLTR